MSPVSAERDRQEIELQIAKAASLLVTKGMASDEAAEAYARARELAEQRSSAGRLVVALWGLWIGKQTRNEFDEARSLSNRLLILTERQGDDGLRLQAHHAAWTTFMFRGEPAPSCDHCEAGRRLYEPERHRSHAQLYGGHDPGVCANYIGSWVEWLLGYPDRAQRSINTALDLAHQLGHPFSLLMTFVLGAVVEQFRRDPDSSLRHIASAEALAAEQRLALFFDARMMRGGVLVTQDAAEEAMAQIEEGLAARQRPGANKLGRPYGLGLLSQVRAHLGNHQGALAAVSEGLAAAAESGERWWEPELYRLQGLHLTSRRELAKAQSSFERALQTARRQQAKSLELRATTSLARLWAEQGRRTEAQEVLAPIYGWFTEGFDTVDLKEAKALLDALT